MEFSPEKAFEEKRLIQHAIRIVEVVDPRFCENLCYMEPDCVSINLDKREDRHGNYKCELNNVTHEGYEHQLEDREGFFYHAAEVNIFFSIHTFLRKYLFLPWHFCFNGLLKLELRQWLSHLKECFVLVSAMTMIITMTLKITKTTTILMRMTHHNYDVHIDDAEDEDEAKDDDDDNDKNYDQNNDNVDDDAFNVRATVSKALARITQDVKADLPTKVIVVFVDLDSMVKDAVKVTKALMSIF